MRQVTNNHEERHALFMGLELIVSPKITKVLILGDFLLVIIKARKRSLMMKQVWEGFDIESLICFTKSKT